MTNFDTWEMDYTANYGGSDKKIGLLYNGDRYMLKLADAIPEQNRNELNSSYTNSPLSEYVSCKILRALGFSVQEVVYGEKTTSSRKYGIRIRPAVACKNFVPSNATMVDFKFISGVVLDEKPEKIPKLAEIYEVFSPNLYFSTEQAAKKALEKYWDLFVIDAFLANFDRHGNNFAYFIYPDKEGEERITSTPIYDCGSCLFPQITDEAIAKMEDYKKEIQMRVDIFPTAALQLENRKKINYKEYMLSLENEDLNRAIQRIVPKINMDIVRRELQNCPELSDIRRKFLTDILESRYEQILLASYNKLQKKEQEKQQEIEELIDENISR